MPFTLTILGSNSATPTSTRHSSSQVLDTGKQLFLLDCAEGTQMQLRKLKVRFQRINHIFITHLHGDHFFGLIGLMTTFHLLGRDRPLHLYCTPELKEALDVLLKVSHTTLIYPVEYHFVEATESQLIYEDKYITVSTIPLLHRIQTCGFLFREKPKPRKIKKSAIADINIPVEAFSHFQQGRDYLTTKGEILKNEVFTTDPPPPVSYAYVTDTAYFEPLVENIRGVQYLFHEATFLEKESSLAKEKFHSTAKEAALIAKLAGAKKLYLGHFSSRYKELDQLLHEAATVFPDTELAEEGKVFILNHIL